MAVIGNLEIGLVLLLVFGRLSCAEPITGASVCSANSVPNLILGFPDSSICPLSGPQSFDRVGVIEGDEISLQRALNMVQKNAHDYVAVLFYASWCPFSRNFRPSFAILSSLYPGIPHFAIEESVIRPSILSKHGVHGFPTLFLLNSTMRVHYIGSRALSSLVAFYTDVTGVKAVSMNKKFQGKSWPSSDQEKGNNSEEESCPFSWARSPENLLQHETYLALSFTFVLMRALYLIFPALCKCAQLTRRRHTLNVRLRSLWEHPLAYLNRAVQLFDSLQEPCKRTNLHGTMNAKAWVCQ